MNSFWLRVRAPFAAFRWLQAGVYRATSPIIPPSAAWGLVLNLAHIETRDHAATAKSKSVTTLTRQDVPPLCLAIGDACAPSADDADSADVVHSDRKATLYQQLHGYPVGSSGKDLATRTHGAKYWIAPVRRELLVDFDVVLGVRSPDAELRQRVADGLAGRLDVPRYGLPFAGDNNCLFDRIDILDQPIAARWYTPIAPDDTERRESCRLTVAIDRGDASRTRSQLFAPTPPIATPPEAAWVWCPAPPT